MKVGDLVKTTPDYTIDFDNLNPVSGDGFGIILEIEWSKFFGFDLVTVLWSSGNVHMLPLSNFMPISSSNV